MGGVVEGRGILRHQHQRVLSDPFNRRFGMGCQDNIHRHLGILEKAVSARRAGSAAAGLRDRALGTTVEILGHSIQAFSKPTVVKPHAAKLLLCPVPSRFRPHRLAPARPGRFRTQTLPPLPSQRTKKNRFSQTIPSSGRLTHRHPIGRLITGPLESARIHKRLHQNRTHRVASLPVLSQPLQRQGQDLRSQVGDLDGRQDQKPVVTDQVRQIGAAGVLAPSNIVIPILQRPSARTERQHPQIAVARTADQISHLGAAQHAAAQVMVALQQRPRNLRVPAMATADRRNRHLTQLLQAARHLRNLDLQPPWTSSTGLANSAPLWQYQNSQAIQFRQRLGFRFQVLAGQLSAPREQLLADGLDGPIEIAFRQCDQRTVECLRSNLPTSSFGWTT